MTSTAESLKSAGSGIFDLTGKRAVVTGASRGIGRAIAVGLAEHGAEVIAVARTVAGLEETVAAAAGAAGSVRAHAADLRRLSPLTLLSPLPHRGRFGLRSGP